MFYSCRYENLKGGMSLKIQHLSAGPCLSPAPSIMRHKQNIPLRFCLLCEKIHFLKVMKTTEWGGNLTFPLFSCSVVSIALIRSLVVWLRVSLLSLSLIISIIIFSICSERWRHKVSPSQHEQLQASTPIYYSTPNLHIFPLCEAHHWVH